MSQTLNRVDLLNALETTFDYHSARATCNNLLKDAKLDPNASSFEGKQVQTLFVELEKLLPRTKRPLEILRRRFQVEPSAPVAEPQPTEAEPVPVETVEVELRADSVDEEPVAAAEAEVTEIVDVADVADDGDENGEGEGEGSDEDKKAKKAKDKKAKDKKKK